MELPPAVHVGGVRAPVSETFPCWSVLHIGPVQPLRQSTVSFPHKWKIFKVAELVIKVLGPTLHKTNNASALGKRILHSNHPLFDKPHLIELVFQWNVMWQGKGNLKEQKKGKCCFQGHPLCAPEGASMKAKTWILLKYIQVVLRPRIQTDG